MRYKLMMLLLLVVIGVRAEQVISNKSRTHLPEVPPADRAAEVGKVMSNPATPEIKRAEH